MKKSLFKQRKSKKRYYILALCLLISIKPIYHYTKHLSEILSWKALITYTGIQSTSHIHQQQARIESLTLENKLLKSRAPHTQDSMPWSSFQIIPSRIHTVLLLHNERWFVTDPCRNCTALNTHGLVGRMDEAFDPGTIRPITHRSSLIIARSTRSSTDYLLQGQGYHQPLLILESDITHYPPEVGDTLVTAGLDHLYPANVSIGIVEKSSGKYVVKPFFNQSMQAQIYLVKPDA